MHQQSLSALAARERLAFVRAPSVPGTEVMVVYQSSRYWHFFHEHYALCACRNVAAGVRYRRVEDRIDDGNVVIREPGETLCNTFVAKPADFKMLFVRPVSAGDVARELGCSGDFHFAPHAIRDDPDLFAKLDRLCTSIEQGHDALEQQSLFASTMIAAARHAERKAKIPEIKNAKWPVERAKAYLRERFNDPVSLEELAAACGLSRFHLAHAFTKEAGMSPHAYQVHVRIERARSLLQKGVSPAAAAASLGFADQSHFTRHFKRIMHVTPKQYASSARTSP